jgi:hypothetical protein
MALLFSVFGDEVYSTAKHAKDAKNMNKEIIERAERWQI